MWSFDLNTSSAFMGHTGQVVLGLTPSSAELGSMSGGAGTTQ